MLAPHPSVDCATPALGTNNACGNGWAGQYGDDARCSANHCTEDQGASPYRQFCMTQKTYQPKLTSDGYVQEDTLTGKPIPQTWGDYVPANYDTTSQQAINDQKVKAQMAKDAKSSMPFTGLPSWASTVFDVLTEPPVSATKHIGLRQDDGL